MGERNKVARQKSFFLETAQAAARTAADRVTTLKKEKIDKEAELANMLDKARLVEHEIKIDPRAGALDVEANLPQKIADLQSTVGQYGIELRQALDELSSGFTPSRYARVADGCRKLLPITMIGDVHLPETLNWLALAALTLAALRLFHVGASSTEISGATFLATFFWDSV
jgi:hypothetical protein